MIRVALLALVAIALGASTTLASTYRFRSPTGAIRCLGRDDSRYGLIGPILRRAVDLLVSRYEAAFSEGRCPEVEETDLSMETTTSVR
jgi:hypothetical protein